MMKVSPQRYRLESFQANVKATQPRAILHSMIEIVDYQERWPQEFETIARQLREALGSLALRIDHIGSTSVPGLAAKDVIDIQVTVARLEPSLTSLITSTGLTKPPGFEHIPYFSDHQPPGYPTAEDEWQKLYFRALEPRRVNLHVRVAGKANQRYALLFRDYLRSSPESAKAYAELKRQLAANLSDLDAYTDVKDPVCDLIAIAAEAWAIQTNWQNANWQSD
jgi:GrpB-like predicted nucleotidyltransferase (UPF0157 family)